jgi:hypothetical protein
MYNMEGWEKARIKKDLRENCFAMLVWLLHPILEVDSGQDKVMDQEGYYRSL